ncbi:MAG: MotA/TolQ/ExbB proton channel family protein [Planctomycetaceae bacterium]|nr:MotA/TolQ/ExbB proton channel family protein [Planctomycetaceae bacterium]
MQGAEQATSVFDIAGIVLYTLLGLTALWGAWCVIVVWMRVGQKRFRSESDQDAFLDALDKPLEERDFDAISTACQTDRRAMPQLIYLAVVNRKIGYAKVRQLVLDRFQRDVLADLEHRLSWVNTVIKSAPMLGLLGTVVGMIGAFAKLATGDGAKPEDLAGDISTALYTTACGLAIAIPLVMCTASINVRIRKMEDLIGAGMTRFLDTFRVTLGKSKRAEK